MSNRTVVITGGNAGIGYACAAAILATSAEQPWHVVLACRDPERARAAVDRLSQVAGALGRVEAMSLDLASLASVRAFAAELISRVTAGVLPPLRGLVCNAGVQSGTTRLLTADGFEATFGVNHLGHFLLVDRLRPILLPPARIVVVASGVHDPAHNWNVPPPAWNNTAALSRGELGPAAAADSPFASGQRRYSTSKLANVYFVYGLARRLPAGVTVNAFDPGLVPGTGLVRNAPGPIPFIAAHVLPRVLPVLRLFMGPNVHTIKESATSLASLVTNSALADTTGRYFEGRREIRSSVESYDSDRAETLWRDSEALTALA